MKKLINEIKELMRKENPYAWAAVIIAITLIICCSVGGCSAINQKLGLPQDHIVEELSERAIEEYLGLPEDSIDFTP